MSTICAVSTAKGGAIGVVRVSGENAISATDRIFKGKRSLAEASSRHILYGNIIDGEDVIDEVLVSIFRAPNSYTGEDCVEISCHGSSYILDRTLSLLLQNGCELAQPGEYTKRAFLNGKLDLSQAEAVADIIASTTAANHHIAMTQMRGGFSRKLENLRSQLLNITSLLELELDFSEEDVEFADRQKLLSLADELKLEITTLLHSFSAGNALKNGVPVAIIGAPNVGKSTLLNRLLNEDRAIVSDIQGTTRDLIEECVTIQGIQFRFIDTAGIRNTDNVIESMGIERSRKAAEKASIIILLTEDGVPYPELTITDEQSVIRVVNKSDKHNTDMDTNITANTPIRISALTGQGISKLESQLVMHSPTIPEDGVLVTNLRHKQVLEQSLTPLSQAITSLQLNMPGDIIAEDLNACIQKLGEITGNISNDEVLGNIFKNFCIGK